MTSIAYKQYCNISYNGGSYVCTPIKGPMSTSQTPSTVENKNRGITNASNGQPEKFGSSDDGNTFSLGRTYHREVTANKSSKNLRDNSGKNLKYISPSESSFRTSELKNLAIGKSSTNKKGQILSYKNDNVNDAKQALRRVRNKGYVVPMKARGQPHFFPSEDETVKEDIEEDDDDGLSVGMDDSQESLYPKITLKGEEKMKVEVNSVANFIEPGFVAFDDRDGDLSILVQKGGIEPKMHIVGTYIITYYVTNSLGHHDIISRIVDVVPDKHFTLFPRIEILGENPYRIQPGIFEEYKDPGVRARHVREGDMTDKVKTYGTDKIDTTKPGRYYVKYSVTDSIGNYSESYREVILSEGKNRNHNSIFFHIVADENNDKLLSIQELERALELLKLDISEDGLLTLMNAFALKHKDKLDYVEFLRLMQWLNKNYSGNMIRIRKYVDSMFPIELDIPNFKTYYTTNVKHKKRERGGIKESSPNCVGPLRHTYTSSYSPQELMETTTNVVKISDKSPSMKISSFMSNHLRKRIDGCRNNCDGLAVTIVDNLRSGTCTNSHIDKSLSLLELECIQPVSLMNIVKHENKNVWAFNNNDTYVKQYGVYNGKYDIINVPIMHPIAVLNYGKEHLITLTGKDANKFTKIVNGISYDFYYGNVSIIVNGDFHVMSLYCFNHGYMGGKNMLRYSEICNIHVSTPDLVIPITRSTRENTDTYNQDTWFYDEELPKFIVYSPEITMYLPNVPGKDSTDIRVTFTQAARDIFTRYTVSPFLPSGLIINNDGSITGTLLNNDYKDKQYRGVHTVVGYTDDNKKQSFIVVIRITTTEDEVAELNENNLSEMDVVTGILPDKNTKYSTSNYLREVQSGNSVYLISSRGYLKYSQVWNVEILKQPSYGFINITSGGKDLPNDWDVYYYPQIEKLIAAGWPTNEIPPDEFTVKRYAAEVQSQQIRNDISTMNYTTRILLPTIVLGKANPSSPNPNVIYRAMGYGLTKATFKESPGYWMQGEEDRGTNNPEIAIKSQPSYGTATIAPNGEDIMFTINTSLFTFMPEDQYDQIEIYSKPLNFENIVYVYRIIIKILGSASSETPQYGSGGSGSGGGAGGGGVGGGGAGGGGASGGGASGGGYP